MLSQIIEGHEKSEFILITDSVNCAGWELFIALTNNLTKKYDKVHAFLFEKLPSELRESLSPIAREKIILHDFSTDPLGWINSENVNRVDPNFSFLDAIKDSGYAFGNTAVIVDSISSLLRYCTLQKFCLSFREFGQNLNKENKSHAMVGLLHHDVCNNRVRWNLEYLADSVLNVGTECEIHSIVTQKKMKPLKNKYKLCKLVHKKQTGKIIESIESYSVLHGTVIDIKPWNPQEKYDTELDPASATSEEDDPTANLTFNLSLSTEEKTARSKLVMPYILKPRHVEVKLEQEPSAGDAGLIYYEPDEADDFDEEDPDDDLDF